MSCHIAASASPDRQDYRTDGGRWPAACATRFEWGGCPGVRRAERDVQQTNLLDDSGHRKQEERVGDAEDRGRGPKGSAECDDDSRGEQWPGGQAGLIGSP